MEDKKCDRKFLPSMMTNEVSKLFRDIINRDVEKLGVQNSYRQLLFHLSRKDGVSQLELARATHLKAPTVSVTLKNMEAEGLVERRGDIDDLRIIHVFLTDKGRKTDDKIRELHHQLDGKMTEGISQEELDALVATLTKLRDNMLRFTDAAKPE